ncbi:MAG: alpha/beta fold hydrolase [Actinomycetota bacterium]|nr:alpha/beta fold hydrolase [Actinomycetota bacterium]
MTARGPLLAGTSEATQAFAAPWGARGYVTPLGGPVHWIEFGSAAPGPPLVFVHGLGGSHLNWVLVGPQLATGRRAVALDLRGFGLTPGGRRTATVTANARMLDRFVREVTGEPVILVGNSMGGLLSILQAHEHPDTVAGLVLIDPALPQPFPRRPDLAVASQFLLYALPGLGELALRAAQSLLPPRQAVERIIGLCFADPSRADPAVLAAGVALVEHRRSMPGCDESLLAAARSLMLVLARPRRYWAMMAALAVPVLLIGGEADRLTPVASIRHASARNPSWDTVVLADVGHTPQLEAPAAVIGTVQGWLDRHVAGDPR